MAALAASRHQVVVMRENGDVALDRTARVWPLPPAFVNAAPAAIAAAAVASGSMNAAEPVRGAFPTAVNGEGEAELPLKPDPLPETSPKLRAERPEGVFPGVVDLAKSSCGHVAGQQE
jgi:hypothetical protein